MRTPHVILLVALCLPLQAGEKPELERAVEMFHSNDPGTRARGTEVAGAELRRLLAPLLKAMDDADPEVRKRAREAILGLVPDHGRDPDPLPQQHQNLGGLVVGKNVFQNGWVIQPGRFRVQIVPQQQGQVIKLFWGVGGQLLQFGAHGHIVAGAGVKVTGITPNSPAAKAGLKINDTIVSINGIAATTDANVQKAVAKGWKGAKLKVLRGKETLELTAP